MGKLKGFYGGKDRTIVLFVQKVQKWKGKHDEDDDIPFRGGGRWFLFGWKYDILSLNREEKASSHKEK